MIEEIEEFQFTAQKTAAWFDLRLGLITNSNLHKLMAYADKITATSELSKGAMTYIEEIFWEFASGFHKEIPAWQLEYGTRQEPKAKAKLAQWVADTTGKPCELKDCEFIYHPELCYYGGSPELEPVMIDGFMTTTEIKSPATGRSHHENIEMCKAYARGNTEILLKIYPELYWQINGNMSLQNTQQCIFATFHETKICTTDFRTQIFKQDDKSLNLIDIQLPKAWKYYKQYAAMHGVDIDAHLMAKHEKYFDDKMNKVEIPDTQEFE